MNANNNPEEADCARLAGLSSGARPLSGCAFDQMYRSWHLFVLHHARNFLDREEDAVDLVQDVFADIWCKRRWPRIRHPAAYFRTVIQREAAKRVSRRGREFEHKDANLFCYSDSAQAPDERFHLQLEVCELHAHIAKLPKRCAAVMKLAAAGMPQKEIAEVLGIGTRAVEKQIARGYSLLRQAFRMRCIDN